MYYFQNSIERILEYALKKMPFLRSAQMPRTPSKVYDQLQISITLGSYGWCQLRVFKHYQMFEFDITEIFSPSAEHFMSLCDAIIDNESITEILRGEPDGCLWRLTPNKALQHTMQLEVFEFMGGELKETGRRGLLIDLTVKRNQLLTMIMMELWKNALLFKEPSYQKTRGQFPWEKLNNLTRKWDESSLGPSPIRLS